MFKGEVRLDQTVVNIFNRLHLMPAYKAQCGFLVTIMLKNINVHKVANSSLANIVKSSIMPVFVHYTVLRACVKTIYENAF